MKNHKVLILDDDSSLRASLFRVLTKKNLNVITSSSIEEAKVLIQGDQPLDLAIVDMSLPDGNGLEFMSILKDLYPQIEVIILTGFGSIENAVKATQKGAFHFITKPFNLDELLSLVDKALEHKHLQIENQQLKKVIDKKYKFDQIIGQSEEIQKVLSLVERVADSEATVLITGNSGTGKELIAKAIHYNSSRSNGPFIPINCGAIPSELLESELFGHVKGAFTGAISNRMGRFELADGGTLFLDEIGDLEPSLQVKILRALQEKSFEPVGGMKTINVNVRLIAATNINLEKAVTEGRFREDLYYRLNVIPIALPSLAERKTDIPLLLNHFLKNYNKNRKLSGFSDLALQSLSAYTWPGNIRELENLVERICILKGEGQIEVQDLPTKYQTVVEKNSEEIHFDDIPADGIDFNTAVDAYENALILKALEKTGWNRNQAAALLRLNRTTLVEKIKKKGLKPYGTGPIMEV
ncbi:MAG: sigma-54-dependent Fis family transcriptional regulator [Bdellovibrionaceae bacterium]|nr:sigma-54-dependent Fis family transcriptional regulator [Pseudobdellovibrionaceae bacterium]